MNRVMAALCTLLFVAPSYGKEPDAFVTPSRERAVEAVRSARAAGRPNHGAPEVLRRRIDAEVQRNLRVSAKLREEAKQLLLRFLAGGASDRPAEAEAMLRLAELAWEDEREAFLLRFAGWEKEPEGRRGPEPRPSFPGARKWATKVLSDYEGDPSLDLAYYLDGFLAYEEGKWDEASARMTTLAARFGASRLLPLSHFALAEMAFSRSDYRAALSHYDRVIVDGEVELSRLSHFKSAWCFWRLGDTDRATRRFLEVLSVSRSGETRDKARTLLEEDALRYLVEAFVEDENHNAGDLVAFLEQVKKRDLSGRVLRKLGETYLDQANYARAVDTYELLARLEPASAELPKWLLFEFEAHDAEGKSERVLRVGERVLSVTAPGSVWALAQRDKSEVLRAQKNVLAALAEKATAYHARAQERNGTAADWEQVASLYLLALRGASGKERGKLLFSLGEVEFFHLGRDSQAAEHYLSALSDLRSETDEHDALFNALFALERAKRKVLSEKKREKGESVLDKQFALAIELYEKKYPRDENLPGFLLKQGHLSFESGAYESAVSVWGRLIERYPTSPKAKEAGGRLLEALSRARNYDSVEEWARKLKQHPGFSDKESQAKLDSLIVLSVFKVGEQRLFFEDLRGAARGYLRAAKEFPEDPRAAQACVNAAEAAKRAHDLPVLKEAGELLLGPLSFHVEAPLGAWVVVTTLSSMGLYELAANTADQVFGALSKGHFAKSERTREVLYRRVLLRRALGEPARAAEAGEQFLARYPHAKEADEVALVFATSLAEALPPKEAERRMVELLSKKPSADSRAELLLVLSRIAEKTGASVDARLAEAVRLFATHKKDLSVRGRSALAEAQYRRGERAMAEFEHVTLSGDASALSERLRKKSDLLKTAATLFLGTVPFGAGEWGAAALYQTGAIYESFAKELRQVKPPKDLNVAQAEAYKADVEPFAVEFEERSLDAYESGLKKAHDLGIYNQWTAKMREALSRLNSELYPPHFESGLVVGVTAERAPPPLLPLQKRDPR